MAQPIGGRLILGGASGGGDDERRHRADSRGGDDRTDVAQTDWTSNCVWAGRRGQEASCLVICCLCAELFWLWLMTHASGGVDIPA
eukprot:2520997-Pyramimonas_sp.AAC.1